MVAVSEKRSWVSFGIFLRHTLLIQPALSTTTSPTKNLTANTDTPDIFNRESRVFVFFMRSFAPARRGPFVSAKGPKTIGARAWPQGGTFAPVPISRAAELASLRQSSPPQIDFGTGAQPRPQAPGCSAVSCLRSRAIPARNVGNETADEIFYDNSTLTVMA